MENIVNIEVVMFVIMLGILGVILVIVFRYALVSVVSDDRAIYDIYPKQNIIP